MAKRLIDAEALLLEIERVRQEFNTGYPRKSLSRKDTIGIINTAPTIDAVAVVRCAKCKYLMKFNPDVIPAEKAIGTCYIRLVNSNDAQFQAVAADDYCSLGKLMDAEKESEEGK